MMPPKAHVAGVLALLMLAASCSGSESGTPTTTSTTTTTTTTTTSTTSPPTTDAPATTAATTAAPTAAELCALTPVDTESAVVESALLTEISGIAVSRQHEERIWAHNDSGGSARLHLIDQDVGADLGAWPLTDAGAFDWEDMAIYSSPAGEHFLYAADFGDNFRLRGDIRIYRAPEPSDLSTPEALESDTFIFTYPEGASDAESFVIDPSSGDFIVITKTAADTPAAVLHAPADTPPDTATELEHIGELDLSDLNATATAADMTTDGRVIGVRTYGEVLLWDREVGESIGDALASAPCVAPSAKEQQGEALAFLADGTGYVTISEGVNPPINRFALSD